MKSAVDPDALLRLSLSNPTQRTQLVAVSRRIVKAEADAEDAAHDAVVQALRFAARFRGDSKVSTWMHRIAFNTALMSDRKVRVRGRHLTSLTREADAASARPALPAPPPDPEALVAKQRQRERLRDAVEALSKPYRSVVESCIYAERSPEATAEQLGLSVAAVRSRLRRARKQLRIAVRPEDNPPSSK